MKQRIRGYFLNDFSYKNNPCNFQSSPAWERFHKTFYFILPVVSQSVCHCQPFYHSQIFLARPKPTQRAPFRQAPILHLNIRLGWKQQSVTNTLVQYIKGLVMTVTGVYKRGYWSQSYETFFFVNDGEENKIMSFESLFGLA